ncbi:hypothetical protein [Mesorhizobium sp. B2-5-3]|uniref:hypothetical protein n=1 Tax=Mesorhizobium sp. B2-5-3 TaxID=2589927 RepID=UPI0015E4584B|nr:hypothetical protein [Mesorhizobium sp. B2-5-3]
MVLTNSGRAPAPSRNDRNLGRAVPANCNGAGCEPVKANSGSHAATKTPCAGAPYRANRRFSADFSRPRFHVHDDFAARAEEIPQDA